jgi:hypothetical protein
MDAQALAERYVAVWNEPDAEARRRVIVTLWAPEGIHCARTIEARGHEALEKRVTASHERNVRDRGFRFRALDDARDLRDLALFGWVMHPADAPGQIEATGHAVLLMDGEGRIVADYLFFT